MSQGRFSRREPVVAGLASQEADARDRPLPRRMWAIPPDTAQNIEITG
jgi:hypothetical protein